MNYFTITTNKEVADNIVKTCQSSILMKDRTFKLGKVEDNGSFAIVQIVANPEDAQINPADLFWLGYYSNR